MTPEQLIQSDLFALLSGISGAKSKEEVPPKDI